jgi:hypothetical protein
VGLAAVLQAIETNQLRTHDFTAWGVLGAPRYLGRAAMVTALQRFADEGAWGVSPHLIPHRSLHSVSGTVSQALKIHGPNYGVGGGPGAAYEIVLAAAALLESGTVPGVWVVLTGWDTEPIKETQPGSQIEPRCGGLALALVPARTSWSGPNLRVAPAALTTPTSPSTPPPLFSLETLLTSLSGTGMYPATLVWQTEGGGRIELLMTRQPSATGHGPHASGGPHSRIDARAGAGAEKLP